MSLLAFIIGDIVQNNSFSTSSNDVGSVNGKDITFDDFRVKVSNLEKSGQGMSALQASNQIWNQEVSIALLTSEFEKLGIRVGEKHIVEVFKADQNIAQNPAFLNALGKFDLAKFKDYFNIENPTHADSIDYLNKREETLLISREIYLDDYMENSFYYS